MIGERAKPTPRTNGTAGARVKSADRSLDLLELLASRADGTTLAEAVEALTLPRSSVHALLQTLAARGYAVWARAERRYRLGPRLAELSARYLRDDDALASAREAVHSLAARCGETVQLAVRQGAEVRYILAAESEHTIRAVSPAGGRAPAHATAAGKALLAAMADDEVRGLYRTTDGAAADTPRTVRSGEPAGLDAGRLRRLTWRTAGSVADLLLELREVRRIGHAHDVEGFVEGVHCVAAPVCGPDGAVHAALSVSVPAARLNGARLVELSALVRDTAQSASAVALGGPVDARTAGTVWRDGRVRIAWSMAQLFVPAYREMERAAHAAAEAEGADLVWTTAFEDERKQACDVHHLLALEPDVLILHPVHAAQAHDLFRAAAAASVPAVCFQRPVRVGAFSLFVGGDTFREGELQIEFLARRLDGRGNVVMIEGDPYNDNARNVAEGSRQALGRYPGLRLLADEVSSFWSRATAKEIATELLDRHGPRRANDRTGIDAIVCANDDMAGGVAEVLAERGWTGHVVLVGGDGDYEALDRLRRGAQDATVFQNPAAIAHEAVRAAVALVRGALAPDTLPRRSLVHSPATRPVPTLDVPYNLVTHDDRAALESYWERHAVLGSLPDAGPTHALPSRHQEQAPRELVSPG